ncbi:uncharacterized protein LOC103169451 isoform X1 [Ornithorhynchus anatinus]|uniref:uncharacterized protein LOC103169451 isoform X1 n=1 Tax=Ornithorhynchus anatinus TaxID=9258 RepID=UPI0010A85DBF|nr:uncharacterized protein LOC103169451 isoform X1 [Ornithorhynchus anatinus]XP_007663052.2 uncharacterized protein LOC103169451 isoform X1 [Ornithorhynchus anatinus]
MARKFWGLLRKTFCCQLTDSLSEADFQNFSDLECDPPEVRSYWTAKGTTAGSPKGPCVSELEELYFQDRLCGLQHKSNDASKYNQEQTIWVCDLEDTVDFEEQPRWPRMYRQTSRELEKQKSLEDLMKEKQILEKHLHCMSHLQQEVALLQDQLQRTKFPSPPYICPLATSPSRPGFCSPAPVRLNFSQRKCSETVPELKSTRKALPGGMCSHSQEREEGESPPVKGTVKEVLDTLTKLTSKASTTGAAAREGSTVNLIEEQPDGENLSADGLSSSSSNDSSLSLTPALSKCQMRKISSHSDLADAPASQDLGHGELDPQRVEESSQDGSEEDQQDIGWEKASLTSAELPASQAGRASVIGEEGGGGTPTLSSEEAGSGEQCQEAGLTSTLSCLAPRSESKHEESSDLTDSSKPEGHAGFEHFSPTAEGAFC